MSVFVQSLSLNILKEFFIGSIIQEKVKDGCVQEHYDLLKGYYLYLKKNSEKNAERKIKITQLWCLSVCLSVYNLKSLLKTLSLPSVLAMVIISMSGQMVWHSLQEKSRYSQ